MATERLRKRLENEYGGGVSGSSNTGGHVYENFCSIGTPLPDLNSKKRDLNEFKPVWQQEVYDDQGRRRFHGAFTGGWSAGYYNTVGSKEGWTPTSFRSSRKDKRKQQSEKEDGKSHFKSNAEDFMDEEDLADFREGKGALRANDAFSSSTQNKQSESDPLMRMLGLEDGPDKTQILQEPSSEISLQQSSIGNRLLQRMGWKPGQGLGPWLSAVRLKRLKSILGISSKSEESPKDHSKAFPPPDTDLIQPKSSQAGLQGLGWQAHEKPVSLSDILQRTHNVEKSGSTPSGSQGGGGGFGIGALEEDSDGEDDVYSTGLRKEDSTLVSSSNKTVRLKMDRGHVHPVSANKGPDKDGRHTWNDGRPMITGFVLSQDPLQEESWFEASLIPKGWQPDPQRVWKERVSNFQSTGVASLGFKERGSMFGEARIPGPPPSISDYLTEKDHQRLKTLKEGMKEVPKIDNNTAKAALQGFIPFDNDHKKQDRYRAYLNSQIEENSHPLRPDEGQSMDEFQRELREFSKSAAIFKPMSSLMANRFESSSTSERKDNKQLLPGLYHPSTVPSLETDEISVNEKEKRREDSIEQEFHSLTPAQRNARMGLFGPNTTRETKKWGPSKLLCKRLNIPAPYPDESTGEEAVLKAKGEDIFDEFGESMGKRFNDVPNVNARWEASKRQLQQLAANRAWEAHSDESLSKVLESEDVSDQQDKSTDGSRFDISNVGLGAITGKAADETNVKPPMRLFKEIFAEDEDSEVKEEELSDQPCLTPNTLPRPLFQPRKRSQMEEDDPNKGDTMIVKKKKKADKDNKSKKNGIRGSLTFNMYEEEDIDEMEITPSRKKKNKSNENLNKISSRPKASDLFDD